MSLSLRVIQDQSKSNSEQENTFILVRRRGLTLLLGKIQFFEDCDWLVVQEGNKRARLEIFCITTIKKNLGDGATVSK